MLLCWYATNVLLHLPIWSCDCGHRISEQFTADYKSFK